MNLIQFAETKEEVWLVIKFMIFNISQIIFYLHDKLK